MFAKERQESIVAQVNAEGRVRVKELSVKFDVTEDCIRKDLAILEKLGLLKKAYGGAVSVRSNPRLYNSEDRKQTSNDERVIIAKKAYEILEAQDVIYLDISLANLELAKLLRDSHKPLTVITNMIDILNTLSHCQNMTVIFIGGQLNQQGDGFWGTLSVQMLQLFKIDKAFLGVVGVDTNSGQISTYFVDDASLKRMAIQQSCYAYLLCEERKFREDGHSVYATLNDIHGLIVAKDIHPKVKVTLDDYGLTII